MAPREYVSVPRAELEAMRTELTELRNSLEDVGRLRLMAGLLLQRLNARLSSFDDEEKTPVRPASTETVTRAFESSSNFKAVRPPGGSGSSR